MKEKRRIIATTKKWRAFVFTDKGSKIREFDIIPRIAIARGETFYGIMIGWGFVGASIIKAKENWSFK